MTVDPYKLIPRGGNQFDFESEGSRGSVRKSVEFYHTHDQYYNVGFGDIGDDGYIDDLSETNNGDLLRVFATVIKVMEDFLVRSPGAVLYFTGSTPQRVRIYSMILTRYFHRFSEKYEIRCVKVVGEVRVETPFVPGNGEEPDRFIVYTKKNLSNEKK
ncbi:DUF6934 family protein [Chitinophaga sp. NPDC101104]|uniref:DUF6934 family protein n=1 Tax=Chitinophaga sp. NPDC101104 TaxID=3390561 RepID=UPI003D07A40F